MLLSVVNNAVRRSISSQCSVAGRTTINSLLPVVSRSFSSSGSGADQDLLISKSDGLMTIKLNRPSKLNSIKQSMYHDFVSALNTATTDSDVRMVL